MNVVRRTAAEFGRIPRWVLVFCWGLLLLLPFLGLRHLWLPDEGRYAEVAREMLVTGDWLTPRLDSTAHFTKPPLTYWLITVALGVFGMNAFAARFFTALAFAGTAALVCLLSSEMGRRRSAFAAGLVFLTSLMPFLAGNILTTDMQLTFWETLAVFFLWRRWNRYPGGRASLWGAYAALALAFMTKGPVGTLVPLLAVGGYCAYIRDGGPFRRMWSPIGLLVFAVIAFPWYLTVAAIHPGLMQYFLGNEVAGRMLTSIHHRNNTFLIYPLVLVFGMLPWTGALFGALRRTFSWRAIRDRRISQAEAFLGSWVISPLVFFCAVQSRLPLYVLGLFVPLAIIVAGRLFPGTEAASGSGRRVVRTAGIASGALALIAVTAAFVPSSKDLHILTDAIVARHTSGPAHLYSTKARLHTLSFYTGEPVRVISDPAPFTADPSPSFLVTRTPLLRSVLPHAVELIAVYQGYHLYYHGKQCYEPDTGDRERK